MANDDMNNEIEGLRAQVAELKAEREAKEKEQAEASSNQASEAAESGESAEHEKEDESPDMADLSSQVKELVGTINQELKEASPVTVLAVFAIGVLVGRLLPR